MRHKKLAYVIAEAGINHCGDLSRAYQLIDAALEAKADAVKFQTFNTELLLRQDEPRMSYQLQNRCGDISQFQILKGVELTLSDHESLKKYCDQKNIDFLSTAYDTLSVDLLLQLGVSSIKIASTDTTNIPLIRYVAKTDVNVILSTGISNLWEVAKAMEAFQDKKENITLLHCVSNYPAPIKELNLMAMKKLQAVFGVDVGFSDHSDSLDIGAYAVCAGASVIEKHITYDKDAPGPDHAASLLPGEFIDYVDKIRTAELALGEDVKRIQPSERKIKKQMQKSLVAVQNISAGTILEPKHLSTMRPATGISPIFFDEVIGGKAKHDIGTGKFISWGDLILDE